MIGPGDHLRDTTLGDVLARLDRACASGVLEIDDATAGLRHEVHLRRGRVQAVSCADGSVRLGDLVAETGTARDEVEAACDFAREVNWRVGRAFVHHGLLAPRLLDALLARQRSDRLARLYAIADARLAFRAPGTLPRGAAEQRPLDPRETFHGRPRARTVATRSPDRAGALRVLGLPDDAAEPAIRARFRALVFDLHPDRAPEATRAERDRRGARLLEVLAAHRALRD